jgi:cell division protein ZipA
MQELRWALLGLGSVFLLGLAVWEWRKPARRTADRSATQTHSPAESAERTRREPSIDEFADFSTPAPNVPLEVPAIHPVESVLVDVAQESAVDVPAAARRNARVLPAATVAIQWPPQNTERVISLRIVDARGAALSGRNVRMAIEGAGMRHGPQQIYHRITDDGAVLASAANLVRPGSLDPQQMDAQEFRGLNLFCILPGPLPAEQMLEELVMLARGLAARVSAIVQDDQGAVLDAEHLTQLRRSVLAAHPDGNEAVP